MATRRMSGSRPGLGAAIGAAIGAAVGAVLLAGCSGGDSAGDAEEGVASSALSERAADDSGVQPRRTGGSTTAGRVAVQTRQVISTGRVRLEADDLAAVRSDVDRLLGRYGGHVAEEETTNDDEGRTSRSTLHLRVPSHRFDQMMAAFGDIATLTAAEREAVDVTTEVIDVDARVRTQEVSLQRLRSFLGQAGDVNAMIRLEAEIAKREAELASLRGQQDYLEDQTSLATITQTMVRAD